jgi:hypothetical protein
MNSIPQNNGVSKANSVSLQNGHLNGRQNGHQNGSLNGHLNGRSDVSTEEQSGGRSESFESRFRVKSTKSEDKGYIYLPGYIARHARKLCKTATETLFLYNLTSFHWDVKGSSAFPAMETVAKMTGIKRRQAINICESLEARGLIKLQKRFGRTHVYDFTPLVEKCLALEQQEQEEQRQREESARVQSGTPVQSIAHPPVQPIAHLPVQPIAHEYNKGIESVKDNNNAAASDSSASNGNLSSLSSIPVLNDVNNSNHCPAGKDLVEQVNAQSCDDLDVSSNGNIETREQHANAGTSISSQETESIIPAPAARNIDRNNTDRNVEYVNAIREASIDKDQQRIEECADKLRTRVEEIAKQYPDGQWDASIVHEMAEWITQNFTKDGKPYEAVYTAKMFTDHFDNFVAQRLNGLPDYQGIPERLLEDAKKLNDRQLQSLRDHVNRFGADNVLGVDLDDGFCIVMGEDAFAYMAARQQAQFV